MRIAILTFCVGADYTKAMEPGLASKRAYAKKHGYDFHEGGEDVWDKTKPISWSKFHFIKKYLNAYEYLFWSDADAIFLNDEIRLESFVELLPKDKDYMWTKDACSNYNNGHLVIRGGSVWVADFLTRSLQQEDLTYHIWWDTAAAIRLYERNATDRDHIHTCLEHWKFNAYVFGTTNSATDRSVRLYQPGDFLIHFAGVYDPWNIYRMMRYVQHCAKTKQPLNPLLLDAWRQTPPKNKKVADESCFFS